MKPVARVGAAAPAASPRQNKNTMHTSYSRSSWEKYSVGLFLAFVGLSTSLYTAAQAQPTPGHNVDVATVGERKSLSDLYPGEANMLPVDSGSGASSNVTKPYGEMGHADVSELQQPTISEIPAVPDSTEEEQQPITRSRRPALTSTKRCNVSHSSTKKTVGSSAVLPSLLALLLAMGVAGAGVTFYSRRNKKTTAASASRQVPDQAPKRPDVAGSKKPKASTTPKNFPSALLQSRKLELALGLTTIALFLTGVLLRKYLYPRSGSH